MSVPAPLAALREHFGFPAFRPGQEQAVRAALDDRDVLVVMPTGAGKSLCYQLPALMRDDLTIVVSPLVSLMQDQVETLARRAPGRVALVNAQQEPAANATAVAGAVRGDVRVLHVAPERFSSPGFTKALGAARIGLFVVDEAHCVSQWGHDFRPDYLRLADAARRLGARAIVASTATATPAVAADVAARLGLLDPVRVSTGFDRPNLAFAVVPSTARSRDRQLVAALTAPGATPAIVYAGTRRDVDALAPMLARALRRPVAAYHAGLGRTERAEAQRRFMGGETDVVVATNAFGMGVDKADVRTVVHAAVPPSLEAYYQEAGRAGRDGAPARALLLASARDKALHVSFITRAEGDAQHVRRRQYRAVWGFVESRGCRRATVLAHFGDPAPAPAAGCCDVCDATVVPAGVGRAASSPAPTAGAGELRAAVVAVVAAAGLDRERIAAVLCGRRSRDVRRARLDGLPGYAAWSDVGEAAVLAAVDGLLADGGLVATDAVTPGLRVPAPARELAA